MNQPTLLETRVVVPGNVRIDAFRWNIDCTYSLIQQKQGTRPAFMQLDVDAFTRYSY
jgi:hypothetical protein